MKILKTQTLRGPNYWSIRHQKLTVMRLDLEDLSDRPSSGSTRAVARLRVGAAWVGVRDIGF